MKITVMTGNEQIISLDVDRDEAVENVKALLEVESGVTLQQQQLLYNGKEMNNHEKLSALGVCDGDLIMMMHSSDGSALRHLKEDRVKTYEYCLPYIYQPLKEDELEQSTDTI